MANRLGWSVRRVAHLDIVEITAGTLPAILAQVLFGLSCTAMVMSTRWMLDFFAPAAGPYSFTYLAILIATLFGRWRSGLTTFISSVLLIGFYVLPGGRFSGSVAQIDGRRFAVDIVVMAAILVFAEIFRRAICEADESLAKIDQHTKALLAAEAALRQSQRMEAVGQLTGGLAHGFNNLLAGISGNLELLDRGLGEGRLADASRYIESAQNAARRAAALTQRLLAFSRHQTLDPQPTDVDVLATGMLELIRRTVGPTISVGVIGAPNLWMATVDPWLLEVNLLSLCVNAGEAMAPNGGRLTIELENLELGDPPDWDATLPQGRFVEIKVSDTGVGMSPEMIARAFDPFFSTKPPGTATGHGLSTVYGFARQSRGRVRIESTPGKGTTVHLLLPRDEGLANTVQITSPAPTAIGGGATVLIIDDEPTIRDFVAEVLREDGFNTIEAHDGPSGMQILQSDANIDLLVVDVGLPGGLSGRQVADAARVERPGLKVLFVTGYSVNVVLNGERFEADTAAITKPFAVTDFIGKVHALLGA